MGAQKWIEEKMAKNNELSSAGHRLGQIVGDWYEQYFALPLLQKIATDLGLYLDSRFTRRSCRKDKILWRDEEGNSVDYDFVMELDGTDKKLGTPVAFFETFWRRGARHSKDKARDDSGKLLPMKSTYPTARVLSIVSAGDFTGPAREFVQSKGVELFYVPKIHIVEAWKAHGVEIDYPDKSTEQEKLKLAHDAEQVISANQNIYCDVAGTLESITGISGMMRSFEKKITARLGATPLEYRIIVAKKSDPLSFHTHKEVDDFLKQDIACPELPYILFSYEVVFGDGDSFQRESLTLDELKKRHSELKKLIIHMERRV